MRSLRAIRLGPFVPRASRVRVEDFGSEDGLLPSRVEWLAMSEALTIHGPSRMAEAPGSRTQPSRDQREATDFEDREGHRAPFASIGPAPAGEAADGIISQESNRQEPVRVFGVHTPGACRAGSSANCGLELREGFGGERNDDERRKRQRKPAPRLRRSRPLNLWR